MTRRTWCCWLVIVWVVSSGCISFTTVQKDIPPDPKTPAKLEGSSPPALEATKVEGVKHALIDTPDVYYYEANERWFRFALDRWFVAFLWNGQWFPVDKGELPPEMAALQPTRTEKKERRRLRPRSRRAILNSWIMADLYRYTKCSALAGSL